MVSMNTHDQWVHVFEKNKTRFDEEVPSSFMAVIDTQFGLGECFSAFWQTFQQSSQQQKNCHYTVLTDHLPDKSALCLDPMDCELQQELLTQWPVAISGYHRLILRQGKLVLTLIVGDRQTSLATLAGTFHHLFIHDIASWTIHDMKRLGLISQMNGTCWIDVLTPLLSVWLKEAGFVISCTDDQSNVFVTGRYVRRLKQQMVTAIKDKHAIVIGAGLAGTTLCERLTARGWYIDLLEASDDIAQGASGNLAGVFMPMLSKDDNPATQLIRTAFFYAQQLWRQVGGIGLRIKGEQCGVFQAARDNEQERIFQEIAEQAGYPETYAQFLTQAQATTFMGIATTAGYLFPQGGWINPPSVCRAMLVASKQHSGDYTLHLNCRVASAVHDDDMWRVYDEQQRLIAQAPTLILANGMGALHFIPSSNELLQPVWGQVSHLPQACVPPLPVVITGDGYLTRPYQGTVCMGATYEKKAVNQVSMAGHEDNLNKLRQFLPTVQISPKTLSENDGRVGIRCVTRDRLPLIGEIPSEQIIPLSGRAQHKTDSMSGLYSVLGLASRGLIWSPLAAEMLACHLQNEPMPVSKKLWQSVSPGRYFSRQK